MKKNVVAIVTELVEPIVAANHFELVDVEFVKEGKDWFLRVYIDKPGGIDLDECVLVNEQLSEKLDALDPDPIPQAYFLDVSSPGAERPLKKESDYEEAMNEYIHVSLYEAMDGEKSFEGFLTNLTPETLTMKIKIKTREKELVIERNKIAKARLAIQF